MAAAVSLDAMPRVRLLTLALIQQLARTNDAIAPHVDVFAVLLHKLQQLFHILGGFQNVFVLESLHMLQRKWKTTNKKQNHQVPKNRLGFSWRAQITEEPELQQ